MSRAPDVPSRPGQAASDLRSVVSIPKENTQSFVVDGFGFETSDISEIRAESLMSASFVGRIPDDPTPDIRTRSPSKRVPTLIGRASIGEVETSTKTLSEDDTHPPPDERTIHAEDGEMALEALAFDDKSYTAPSTAELGANEGWSADAPSEVTHGPSLDDEPDDTESKEIYNDRTPYGSFTEPSRKDALTNEEIEGMLNELDDVVHLGDDDGPKAKRRTRKAR